MATKTDEAGSGSIINRLPGSESVIQSYRTWPARNIYRSATNGYGVA